MKPSRLRHKTPALTSSLTCVCEEPLGHPYQNKAYNLPVYVKWRLNLSTHPRWVIPSHICKSYLPNYQPWDRSLICFNSNLFSYTQHFVLGTSIKPGLHQMDLDYSFFTAPPWREISRLSLLFPFCLLSLEAVLPVGYKHRKGFKSQHVPQQSLISLLHNPSESATLS